MENSRPTAGIEGPPGRTNDCTDDWKAEIRSAYRGGTQEQFSSHHSGWICDDMCLARDATPISHFSSYSSRGGAQDQFSPPFSA
mmetsp:Transcript_60137/g.141564  ORF Transcript_60137/g.141564 Transcript_60137/m.141564 type:complete len:84 (+) Transcript_60137:334-585(+)